MELNRKQIDTVENATGKPLKLICIDIKLSPLVLLYVSARELRLKSQQ
jgi:hypothetical protein